MNKKVYKLKPCALWKIGAMESWLSDKAAEGLQLTKIGATWCTFEKVEPNTTAYRIHISKEKEDISAAEITHYSKRGWTHITSFDRFHIFAAPSEYTATEVYLSGEEYAEMLNPYLKSNKRMIFISLITLFAIYLMSFSIDGSGIFVEMAKLSFLGIIPVILILFSTLTGIMECLSQRKLRKYLLLGNTINHHTPWHKEKLFHFVNTLLYFVITIFLIFSPFFIKNEKVYTSEVNDAMPIINPIDTEPTDTLNNTNTMIFEDESILSYKYYDAHINGQVPSNYDGNKSKGYYINIDTEFYDLKYNFLVKGVAKNLVKTYFYPSENVMTSHKINNTDFDILYIDKYNSGCKYVAAIDNKVIYVNYHGGISADKMLQLIKEQLLK